MAEILNEVQDEELNADEEYTSFDEPDTQPDNSEGEQPAEPEMVQDEDEDIPDKYRGKSAKEIVRMHQEAEKLLGRQSSEVGELRKLVDNFILSQTNTAQPKEEEDDVDFFEDPQKAIERAIAKHPKVREAEQASAAMRQQAAMATLKTKHPDYQEVLGDPAFSEWVQASKIRMELYNRADRGYDVDSADELLATWKERQRVVNQTKEVEDKALKQSRKAAATGGGKGGGEGRSRKVYRRADIINLMQNDPARYLELADEITLAYSEGRVK
jgi:hypothetical protein